MTKDNVILIGMPGSGKSTLGVLLAKAMNYRFLDTDLLIQESEGMLLSDIIAKIGKDAFVELEGRINASVEVSRTVIAPGGSAVYSELGMNHFRQLGTVIYLHVSLESLKKRLGDLKKRGVICKEGQTLEDIFEERRPYYEKYADIVIDVSQEGVGEILERIQEELKKKNDLENC